MKQLVACLLVAGSLLLYSAQSIAADSWNITAVNTRTGVVTARESDTRSTLQFRVPLSRLRSLKIGQAVHVDYRANRVTVDGSRTPFAIIDVRPAEPVGQPATPAQAAIEMHPAEPVGEPATAAQATVDLQPAEPVGEPQASAQAASSASNPLGSRSGLPPVKAGTGTENPGGSDCKARGGEWRCATIGTDIRTGEPLRSCHCINP